MSGDAVDRAGGVAGRLSRLAKVRGAGPPDR
jgi:hypothetical protein